jgi:hypothetical protein
MLFLAGCNRTGAQMNEHSVLFDDSGRERSDPEGNLFRMLVSDDLSDAERRRLVDELVSVLDAGQGFSQVAVAQALLSVTSIDPAGDVIPSPIKVNGPSLVTQRMVEVLARKWLRISRMPAYDEIFLTWLQTDQEERRILYECPFAQLPHSLVRIPRPRWNYPVDASFVVRIGVNEIPLTLGLGAGNALQPATGWRIGRAQVWLDGRLVADEPRRVLAGPNTRSNESVQVILVNELEPQALLDRLHTYKCSVELVAPNGLSATVEEEYEFRILDNTKGDPYPF